MKQNKKFYQQEINKNSSNQKALYKLSNSLLHRKKTLNSSHMSSPELSDNKFAAYFTDKIETIVKSFNSNDTLQNSNICFQRSCVLGIIIPNEKLKKNLILSGNSKWCQLESILTDLLKKRSLMKYSQSLPS